MVKTHEFQSVTTLRKQEYKTKAISELREYKLCFYYSLFSSLFHCFLLLPLDCSCSGPPANLLQDLRDPQRMKGTAARLYAAVALLPDSHTHWRSRNFYQDLYRGAA